MSPPPLNYSRCISTAVSSCCSPGSDISVLRIHKWVRAPHTNTHKLFKSVISLGIGFFLKNYRVLLDGKLFICIYFIIWPILVHLNLFNSKGSSVFLSFVFFCPSIFSYGQIVVFCFHLKSLFLIFVCLS